MKFKIVFMMKKTYTETNVVKQRSVFRNIHIQQTFYDHSLTSVSTQLEKEKNQKSIIKFYCFNILLLFLPYWEYRRWNMSRKIIIANIIRWYHNKYIFQLWQMRKLRNFQYVCCSSVVGRLSNEIWNYVLKRFNYVYSTFIHF